ncbi:hypothetical protein H4582DRAFT_1135512 [Lactarius indigo]|nr:hypothetical protein H4582DRAFT_1135512 [Lactarius indigo]
MSLFNLTLNFLFPITTCNQLSNNEVPDRAFGNPHGRTTALANIVQKKKKTALAKTSLLSSPTFGLLFWLTSCASALGCHQLWRPHAGFQPSGFSNARLEWLPFKFGSTSPPWSQNRSCLSFPSSPIWFIFTLIYSCDLLSQICTHISGAMKQHHAGRKYVVPQKFQNGSCASSLPAAANILHKAKWCENVNLHYLSLHALHIRRPPVGMQVLRDAVGVRPAVL